MELHAGKLRNSLDDGGSCKKCREKGSRKKKIGLLCLDNLASIAQRRNAITTLDVMGAVPCRPSTVDEGSGPQATVTLPCVTLINVATI